MIKNTLCAVGLLFVGMVSAVSCSSDDDKYHSESPRFSDITLADLATGETTIRAGEPFVATAVQSSKGKLLNSTQYKWDIVNEESDTHKYTSSVVYDHESSNPSDTIVIPNAGRYELTFFADYNVSGIATGSNFTESLGSGGTATYQASSLKFKVKLSKTVVVR